MWQLTASGSAGLKHLQATPFLFCDFTERWMKVVILSLVEVTFVDRYFVWRVTGSLPTSSRIEGQTVFKRWICGPRQEKEETVWKLHFLGWNCESSNNFRLMLFFAKFQVSAFHHYWFWGPKKRVILVKLRLSESWLPCTPGLHEAAQFLSLETINRPGPRRKVIFQPANFQVLS